MEQNIGLTVEMSKRLLKKPDATVDAVLKVGSSFENIQENNCLSLMLLEYAFIWKLILCRCCSLR